MRLFSIAPRLGVVALLAAIAATANAQSRPTTLAATRASTTDLRAADQIVDAMIRDHALVVRDAQRDSLMPDRVHERLDQYVRGVRIVGGDLTRQTAPDGTVSVFGTLHTDLTIDLAPRLSIDDARAAIASAAGGTATGPPPELVVLPLSDGYHLAYRGRAIVGLEIVNVFIDADSGSSLRQYSDFQTEGTVGAGKGTYGDDKKISVTPMSGTFVATDGLRPSQITTYDMKGNLQRTFDLLDGVRPTSADLASDSDNSWTDPTVVDAQVYAGWYYDYLFKRFNRSGVDGHNLRMSILTHPVRLADIASAPSSVVGLYYLNAFFCADCGPDNLGAVTFGEGAPRGYFAPGVEVKPYSAALDVVAHELTHAVTASAAALNGFPYSEGNSLNEGFSDIFGIATAFAYLPPGDAVMQASYLAGKDKTVPLGARARSLSSPSSTGYPDHYSGRVIGGDPHANGVIAGHAFYLAIEGGTNRTSGRPVQGVGAANRDQVEKSFFRALTVLMPSSATFGLTRAATIQAARDLYGAGSVVEPRLPRPGMP